MKNKQNEKILENVKLKISISNFEKEEKLEMKKTKINILKVASVACCVLVLIAGGVFAKNIEEVLKKFFIGASDGVNIAANNGYVAKGDGKIQTAQGVDVSVDSFMIDDYNFTLNLKFKLHEETNINDFESIDIKDLKVIDENGVYVFNTHEIQWENEEQRRKYSYPGGYTDRFDKINDNEYMYRLIATGSSRPFPKSKKLSISFTQLRICKLVYTKGYEEKERTIFEGNWALEIDVPEEFYNRQTIEYKATKCTGESIDLNSITATLSNTAFRVSIPVIKTKKVDYELLHTSSPKSVYDKSALQKEYVETENGEKFVPAGISDGDGGYGLSSEPNTIIDYSRNF